MSQIGQESAPLAPIALIADGVKGVNFQQSNQLLDPSWATVANNLVLSSAGSLTARQGWSQVTTTPQTVTSSCQQLFEFIPTSGSNQVITAVNHKLYVGTTTLSDVTGSLTITANNWKFVNFNGLCYGLQTGHPLIQYTGSGNFTAVSAATGSVPNGNELLSAFGRLWGTDSTGQLLIYSQLLDATNWNVTGAGSFNLTSVWGTGNDTIVALASYNDFLIVFGTRNVIVWWDSSGSDLGMNPVNMSVYDIVPGIGCAARDSVQNCNGDDLAFLAYSGVQSLKRIIIERSNAIKNLSLNVRDTLNAQVQSNPLSQIKSTYNAFNGFYLLLLPSTPGIVYCFDTKITLDDGSWRVTTWDNFIPTALITLHDNITTYSYKSGAIYLYGGTQDAGGPFTVTYNSPWLNLGQQIETRLKMLKRISAIISYYGTSPLNVMWAFDFSPSFYVYTANLTGSSTFSQYGLSQWGIDSWGAGISSFNIAVPASGTGQYVKIGLSFVCNNSTISFLQTQLYAKVGRVI